MSKEITNLDAFIALRDLDDEEIVIPASRHTKRLKEGKSFDVRNDVAMEAAQKFNEASEADDTLEVVDVDKDAIDKAIDSRSPNYAGDVILTCPYCRGQRIERVDNLSRSEDGTGYIINGNTADGRSRQECPNCGRTDAVWQLAKQSIGKPEEPKLDNDKPTEEASFDNDMTSTEKEGEPAVATEEPEVVEEPKAEEPEKDEGGAWDETDAEDDTADMKDTTGDVIDQDDVKADDTEEEFPWDDEEEKKPEDDILFDDEKKEKKESLNEEEQVNEGLGDAFDTVEDLLEDIIEPENIRKVNVYDSEGNEIYSGEYDPDSYTNTWVDELMAGWDVEEGRLILNITSDAGYNAGYTTLEDSLGTLDDATDKIDLFDVDTEEELETGLTKEEVIEKYGDWALASIEAPDVLNIYIDGGLEYEDIEEDDYEPKLTTDPYAAGQWYESLTKKICEANGLRYYRTEKEGTQEYYIQESIREKEDLGVIYEHFLRNIASAELINEFKEATGYRTTLDEMFEKETVVEGGSFKTDERESMKKAQKLSQDTDCNVVYGYTTSGTFYELPDMMSVATDRELQFATELVKAKYHPTGTVRVWYKKNNDTNLDESHEHHVCLKCGKEICECNITESNEDEAEPIEAKKFENDEKTEIFTELPDYDVEVEQKGDKIEIELEPKNKVESFKTRKELADAIKECKNNNQPYKVTKSLTEGYRYDLIVESTEEEHEYIKKAQEFCKKISEMDLETVEDTLLDYNFEEHAPEDQAEEMIFDALKARKAVLETELEAEEEQTYLVDDINEDIGESERTPFDTLEEANEYFDLLKEKYKEDNTHTLYLWDSKNLNDNMEDEIANPKYLRKWNAQVGIKDEFKDPTLTEENVNESPDVPATVEAEPEQEVIDAPTPDENAGTAIVPEGMDERDVELVNKLTRIANDTAEAIRANYGVDADPRLIVADMIQDLRLISGDIRPEELAHTPMNDLTREMYAMYDGFNNLIDDMYLGRRRTAAERLTHAIQSLDGEEFSTPAIEQKIASDHFIEYVNRGAVPFLGTHIERLPAPEEENN